MPHRKRRFLPYMSATFPRGTRKTAADSRKAVGTHPITTALIRSSSVMAGRAMLMEELMKGTNSEERVETRRTVRFVCNSSIATVLYFTQLLLDFQGQ
jgi:hypothetical protein